MGLYKCKICGKMFERVGNGVYCPGPHYRPCPVCGKPVEFHSPADPVKCCSPECVKILSDRSRKIKICKECGKDFKPKNGRQIFCDGPHISTCVICGKEFEYTCSPKEKPKTCSKECQEKLRSKTAQERYGVDNVSKLPWVQDKISKINGSEEVKAKRAATCMKRYGVDNVAKNEEIRMKMIVTMTSQSYLEGREKTCIEKYGTASPMANKEVQEKRRQAYFDKYGTFGAPKTKQFYEKRMIDSSKIDYFLAFKEDPKSFIEIHYKDKPTIQQLRNDLGVTDTPIYDILNDHDCSECIEHTQSCIETEVFNFIRELDSKTTIIKNDRTQIKPYELDIYLPEYKIAFECNPASTHNSSIAWLGSDVKPYSYHQMKSLRCQDVGIFLFHIFGYEWTLKEDIIKSMIRNLLHKNLYSIGARNTSAMEISFNECKDFLNENHRQGYTNSKVKLGLRDKKTGEIVSVMTFSHPRATIGNTSRYDENDWELSRFCSKLNTNVSGAASKLLQYFIKQYNPNIIISFSDIAHTKGKLYEVLGFQKDHMSSPSYFYTDIYDTKFLSRVSCQKKNIKTALHDDTIDLSKTEHKIMIDHKFVRTYDSGVIKWILTCRQA